MKNLKKILALVLAFACAFTMFAGAMFTDNADIQAVDAVNMLTSLGVIEGFEDGSFRPDGTVTRAQMAKMIFVVRNNKVDDVAYRNNTTKFTDVNDNWAAGYIKFCESQGIVAGKSETLFKPDDIVTGVEAAKMLLVLAGYDPDKAGLTGPNWATNTLRQAGKLMNNVDSPLEEGLPRQYAAQIIYNALEAYRVKWSDDSNSFDDMLNGGVKETVGRAYMGLYRTAGTLVSISGNTLELANIDEAESDATGYDKRDNEDSFTTSFTRVDTDYSELLGQKVKVLFKDAKANSVLAVYPMSGNTAITVNANEIEADDEKVKFGGKSYSVENDYDKNYIDVYYTGVEGKMSDFVGSSKGEDDKDRSTFTSEAGVTYGISSDTYTAATVETVDGSTTKVGDPVVVNGYKYRGFNTAVSGNAQSIFDNWDSSAAVMTFVDSDDNGKFNAVIITDYKAAEVTSVSSSKLVAGKSYNYDEENIDEGFVKEDWAIISWDRFNDCQRIQRADVVSARLNGLKKNSLSENCNWKEGLTSYYGVKYNEYLIGDSWYNSADEDRAKHSEINTVQAGDTVDAVIVNGIVYKIKRVSEGNLSDVTNVAMVVNLDTGIGGDQAKLQFFNDTTRVVDVDSDSSIKYDNLVCGQLYEYSISGGEYSFQKLVKESDYYGEYTYKGGYSFGTSSTLHYNWKSESNGTGDGKIDGTTIDDKAKVILFKAGSSKKDNDSKVITGKQLKTISDSEITKILGSKGDTSSNVDWFTADISGLTRVAALTLNVDDMPGMIHSHDYYGYIMDGASYSGSNEVQYDLLVQGTDEIIRVYEKNVGNLSKRQKNTLIGFKSLDNEDADKRYIDEVEAFQLDMKGFGLGAIANTNTSKSKVQIAGTGAGDLEVNADTVLFFIDTDAMTGNSTDSSRAIQKANSWYDNAKGVKVQNSDGKYYIANCLYLYSGDELEVLVVENGDGCFRGPYAETGIFAASDTTPVLFKGTSTLKFSVGANGLPANPTYKVFIDNKEVKNVTVSLSNNTLTIQDKSTTLQNLSTGTHTLVVEVYNEEGDNKVFTTDSLTFKVQDTTTEPLDGSDKALVEESLQGTTTTDSVAIAGKVTGNYDNAGKATLSLGGGTGTEKDVTITGDTTVAGDVKLVAANVTVDNDKGATLTAKTATVVGTLPKGLTLNVTDTLKADTVSSLENITANTLEAKSVTVDKAAAVKTEIKATSSITVAENVSLADVPTLTAPTVTVKDTVNSENLNKIKTQELVANVEVSQSSKKADLSTMNIVGNINVAGEATIGKVSATSKQRAAVGTVTVQATGKATFTQAIAITQIIADSEHATVIFNVLPTGTLTGKFAYDDNGKYTFVSEPITRVEYVWTVANVSGTTTGCWVCAMNVMEKTAAPEFKEDTVIGDGTSVTFKFTKPTKVVADTVKVYSDEDGQTELRDDSVAYVHDIVVDTATNTLTLLFNSDPNTAPETFYVALQEPGKLRSDLVPVTMAIGITEVALKATTKNEVTTLSETGSTQLQNTPVTVNWVTNADEGTTTGTATVKAADGYLFKTGTGSDNKPLPKFTVTDPDNKKTYEVTVAVDAQDASKATLTLKDTTPSTDEPEEKPTDENNPTEEESTKKEPADDPTVEANENGDSQATPTKTTTSTDDPIEDNLTEDNPEDNPEDSPAE